MDHDWQRLADHVQRRRVELGFSKREAIRRAGVSSMTWLKVENEAEPIDDGRWAAIARALNWTPDSVLKVLIGGDPEEIPEPPSVQDEIEELRRRVERLEAKINE